MGIQIGTAIVSHVSFRTPLAKGYKSEKLSMEAFTSLDQIYNMLNAVEDISCECHAESRVYCLIML